MIHINDFQVHDNLAAQLAESALYIEEKLPKDWRKNMTAGLVLGSGLGSFADDFEDTIEISYDKIPHFPPKHNQSVAGHAGKLKVIRFNDQLTVVCMQGRYHLYEGYTAQQVAYPTRVFKQLGLESLIITNAAGGINSSFNAGDLMLITDHLNLTGRTPLLGPNPEELGPRFVDMTEAYDAVLQQTAFTVATKIGLTLQQGVYAGLLGPTYETPAEVKMLKTLGADAVGMSTVTEVIAANHCGLKVLGLSCVSNMAAGMSGQKLSHTEVMETGKQVEASFKSLLSEVLSQMGLTSSVGSISGD